MLLEQAVESTDDEYETEEDDDEEVRSDIPILWRAAVLERRRPSPPEEAAAAPPPLRSDRSPPPAFTTPAPLLHPQDDPEAAAEIEAAFAEVLMHHIEAIAGPGVAGGGPHGAAAAAAADDSDEDFEASGSEDIDSEDLASGATDDAEEADLMGFELGIDPISMHCALREHDAPLAHRDARLHHLVRARTHHHQTADAVAFAPFPAGGGGGGALPFEDIVVASANRLAVWRLGATARESEHAALLAQAPTGFPVYSLAVSGDGALVAACTATGGLVALYHLERTPPGKRDASGPPAGGGAAAATSHPAPAGCADTDVPPGRQRELEGLPPDARAALDHALRRGAAYGSARLEHYATLQCRTGRETMANCVRFGRFGGRERLLLAHQDGLLYMLDPPPPPTEASRTAAAAAAAAARTASLPGEAPPMMALLAAVVGQVAVSGLPSWPKAGSSAERQVEGGSVVVVGEAEGEILDAAGTLAPAVVATAKFRVLRAGPLDGQPALTKQWWVWVELSLGWDLCCLLLLRVVGL